MKSPDYLLFQQENPKEWKKLLNGIFPQGLPLRAVWREPAEICTVLNQLGSAQDVHYTFLPSGGGLDLHGARKNGNSGLVEIELGSLVWIGQPATLSFESFGDESTHFWCYFRLELQQISVLPESSPSREGYYQYLTEIAPGEYEPTSAWDNRYEEGCELAPGARLIVRALKGSMVIFAKFSPYNMLSHATSAVHEGLDGEAFRERIQLLRQVALASPHTTTFTQLDSLLLHGDPMAAQ